MITTDFEEIAEAFKVSVDSMSFNTVGVMQLTTGGGTFFTVAAAAVLGKRPVFIIATMCLLGTSAWGFFAGVSGCLWRSELHLICCAELLVIVYHVTDPRLFRRSVRDSC
jgi:hypothetical protein